MTTPKQKSEQPRGEWTIYSTSSQGSMENRVVLSRFSGDGVNDWAVEQRLNYARLEGAQRQRVGIYRASNQATERLFVIKDFPNPNRREGRREFVILAQADTMDELSEELLVRGHFDATSTLMPFFAMQATTPEEDNVARIALSHAERLGTTTVNRLAVHIEDGFKLEGEALPIGYGIPEVRRLIRSGLLRENGYPDSIVITGIGSKHLRRLTGEEPVPLGVLRDKTGVLDYHFAK